MNEFVQIADSALSEGVRREVAEPVEATGGCGAGPCDRLRGLGSMI
jgi:hypothetical protein